MGLRDLWYYRHHAKNHHSNRTDGYIAPNGEIEEVFSTHCDKRHPNTEAKYGIQPEFGNPWHGTRTNAEAHSYPAPQIFPMPTVTRPILVPILTPVVTTVSQTVNCPTSAMTVAYGPWRSINQGYPQDTQPVIEVTNPYYRAGTGRP